MSDDAGGSLVIWCDEEADLSVLSEMFEAQRWKLERVTTREQLLAHHALRTPLCVVVCDDPGRTRLEEVCQHAAQVEVPVIACVRQGDVPRSVLAMQSGAVTVVEMPPGKYTPGASTLIQAIDEFVRPACDWRTTDPRDAIVRAPDSPLLGMLEVLPQIARSDSPVLLTGESGVGKDLLARVIHELGHRTEQPYVSLNCGAIPENLLESELFGHVRGAFTGATSDRKGQLVAADGGTLFLDEIGEMPTHLQVKLLRVLQDGMVTPLGATRARKVDFRIIAATNIDVEEAVERGAFREDLFYRLNVLPIEVPALRDHPQDIAPLCEHFIAEQNAHHHTHIVGVTHETRTLLKRYEWPGNIRELKNVIERICVLKQSGFIERDDLPESVLNAPPAMHFGLDVPSEGIDMTETLDRLERTLLSSALKKAAGNKAQAARLLGINRTTLVEKLKRKNIDVQ